MVVSVGVLILGMRSTRNLEFLRRYKYIFLFSGLLLTALTLVLGANPGGSGPRLWLGCCGLYLQPSEPLKLLLIVYLAAYFADRLPIRSRLFPLIFPTLILTGIALAILWCSATSARHPFSSFFTPAWSTLPAAEDACC